MNQLKGILLSAVLFIAFDSFFVLAETEKAVILFFGELHDSDVEPGLNFKLPFIQNVKRYSAKLRIDDASPQTYLTQNNEGLTVDSYAKWKISDVAQYYKATGGDERRLQNLLEQRIDNGLRNLFGEREKWEVISGERDEVMIQLLDSINEGAIELGINVVDIRINRIELPETASNSVYQRMVAERRRLANEARAEGKEISETIQAQADKEVTVMLAEAYATSETTRGEGDAQAVKIYANAYNRAPELYAFVRSLEAYRKVFAGQGNVMVLEPDSDFFEYLKSPAIKP